MRLARTFGLAAGLAMVGSMALAGGASAKPLEHTDFHDVSSEIINDFCEVSGLTVQVDSVEDGLFLFNPHGPDEDGVQFTTGDIAHALVLLESKGNIRRATVKPNAPGRWSI